MRPALQSRRCLRPERRVRLSPYRGARSPTCLRRGCHSMKPLPCHHFRHQPCTELGCNRRRYIHSRRHLSGTLLPSCRRWGSRWHSSSHRFRKPWSRCRQCSRCPPCRCFPLRRHRFCHQSPSGNQLDQGLHLLRVHRLFRADHLSRTLQSNHSCFHRYQPPHRSQMHRRCRAQRPCQMRRLSFVGHPLHRRLGGWNETHSRESQRPRV